MANQHRVTFIRKDTSRPKTHQITHVGGELADGTPWTIPVHDVIHGIESGRFNFVIDTKAEHDSEEIIVSRKSPYGAFIRAKNDKHEPLRLLALPDADAQKEINYY